MGEVSREGVSLWPDLREGRIGGVCFWSPHYSQRNTFAESAVQIANTTTNAMTSPL